jgi:hypothetical protein
MASIMIADLNCGRKVRCHMVAVEKFEIESEISGTARRKSRSIGHARSLGGGKLETGPVPDVTAKSDSPHQAPRGAAETQVRFKSLSDFAGFFAAADF